MLSIKKITTSETYLVRQEVLRTGKPIETCYFNGDNDTTTSHFGLFENDKIIGVVSVFQANCSLFKDDFQFQIRGMAILEKYQNKGLGEQLLIAAEKYCWEDKANLIWFNAREKAVSFYKKLEYSIIGPSFNIPDVGTHFVMFKKN